MRKSSDKVLNAVISLLEQQNRDLKTVTLEEVKDLTFRTLCGERPSRA